MFKFFSTAAVNSLLALPASAALLTFDGIQDRAPDDGPEETSYAEDGFIFELIDGGLFGGFDDLHFDLGGEGIFMDAVSMRAQSGGLFDVLSLDIDSIGDLGLLLGPAQNNIVFEALRDGIVVATEFATSQTGDIGFNFGGGFSGIDGFTITGLYTGNLDFDVDDHFAIDNIIAREVPSAVPLPASGLLLIAALGAGGLMARRRRR